MKAEYLQHKDGTRFVPITQPDAVIDSEGKTLTTTLTEMQKEIDEKGGGSGTTDYSKLSNKPKINNVELDGDKSLSDIGAVATTDSRLSDARTPLAHTHAISDVENLQSSLTALEEADSALSQNLQGCQTNIGDMTKLETTANTDLVSAINEIKESGGGSVSVDDTTIEKSSANVISVKDGGITLAKLASSVQTSISRADEIYEDYINAQAII